jgi:hypothetical protein
MSNEDTSNIMTKPMWMDTLRVFAVSLLIMLVIIPADAQDQYEVKYGSVRFHSEEPSEYVSAFSSNLSGTINIKTGNFFFRLPVGSFKGFNCPLLRLHFNANCMESISYPDATFSGILLDKVDLSKDGEYNVRAKGKMKIHGVEQSRVVRVHAISKDGKISVDAKMPVVLEEHNIRTPRMMMKRVATEVVVDVSANLVASAE